MNDRFVNAMGCSIERWAALFRLDRREFGYCIQMRYFKEGQDARLFLDHIDGLVCNLYRFMVYERCFFYADE